ncbi:MAG: hypothetical protein HQK52_06050 [Oligoflexia bacterium]|nr:hypothetical protein [Oligoflexia bacterium]
MKKIKVLFLLLILFLVPLSIINASDEAPIDSSVSKMIAHSLKKSIKEWNSKEIHEVMKRQYIKMRLMDKQGQWLVPELATISQELLPTDLSPQYIDNFIDKMAVNAEKNSYLKKFLDQTKLDNFPKLKEKMQSEEQYVFPDVIAYALVLDKFTKASREDWRVLKACYHHWKDQSRPGSGIYDNISWFQLAKLFSVEAAIKKMIEFHENPQALVDNPGFCSFLLPLNIWEAILDDFRKGNFDNGICGITLANYGPDEQINEATGTGPAEWSKDNKGILLGIPLAKKWDDLYSTWNMAFVSDYSDFPYKIAKLIIPQVGDHIKNDKEYIYNRGIALYAHVHHAYFGYADLIAQGKKTIDWSDPVLTEQWGKINQESAKEYVAELRKLCSH